MNIVNTKQLSSVNASTSHWAWLNWYVKILIWGWPVEMKHSSTISKIKTMWIGTVR